MFNDFWMMDNGFIQRERTGDLRDLIARRHDLGEDYTLRERLVELLQSLFVCPSYTHSGLTGQIGRAHV